MDKIKELLKQLGATEELSKQITEALEGYTTAQKTLVEDEYKKRLSMAKKVCLEETQRYKAELAKKVQLFLEARADKIEGQIAKQVAIRESAAEGNLKKIKTLLEGIEVNAQSEANLQAVQSQLDELQKKLKVVTEERNVAVQKANFANEIARKALKRNRILESKATPDKVVTEEKAPGKAPEKAPQTPAPQVVKKQGAQSKIAAPISEDTIAKRPKAEDKPQPATLRQWDPSTIASTMD